MKRDYQLRKCCLLKIIYPLGFIMNQVNAFIKIKYGK